jgi:UDP-N-acetylmuramyl pentapeptide phosphotransferase/UDP-N-acetylglucosamine-1-phosphate transferase
MFTNLNYVHIAVATLAYFVVGALWFGPLFGKLWIRLTGISGLTEEDKKKMPQMFGITFVLSFVLTLSIACVLYFVQPSSVLGALKVGLLAGGGFIFCASAMNYMYAKRPFKLTLLDAGYHTVALCLVSVILTLWR